MLISTAYAQEAAPAAMASSGAMMDILFMLAFVVIIYFFLLRPQNKRFKAHQELISGLKQGDKVVTDSGLYGTIKKMDDTTVSLEIADGVVVTVVRNSVAALNEKDEK